MLKKANITTMILSYIKELFRPEKLLMLLRHYFYTRQFKNNNLQLSFYTNLKNVKIGENVFIGQHCSFLNTEIGSFSYCNSNSIIRDAIIGKFVSIGSEVLIGVGEHPTNFVSTHPAFYANNKSFSTFSSKQFFIENGNVHIGNDVWIGSRATLMNGVKIGDGAIIAYGAVVTKDVKPYSIVGGVPAKHIKYRVDENIIDDLLGIKWWDLQAIFYKNHYELFHDPIYFLNYYKENKDYVESFRLKAIC